MSIPPSPPPNPQPASAATRRNFRLKHVFALFGGVVVLLAACVALLAWYANTSQFQDRVRRQVIATLEQATGGRVELRSLRWRLLHLQLEAQDITIHGLEAPGEIPYAHIDKLRVRAKILSFFRPKVGLNLLSAEHPVFHLIVYPDGSTNQPRPKTVRNGKPVGDTLFDLAIDRVEVADGLAIVNERKIPFDLAARKLGVTIAYSAAPAGMDRYLANVTVEDLIAHRAKEPPVHSTVNLRVSLGRNSAEVKSFRLKTGPSLLEASGAVENFSDPHWHFAATGKIDVREVEALTEVEGLGGGIVDLRIKGEGTGDDRFLVDGDTRIQDGTYKTQYVTVRDANATTAIRATREELRLSGAKATLREGGTIEGDLRLLHWLPSSSPQPLPGNKLTAASNSGKARKGGSAPPALQEMQGILRATLAGVTLRSVLAATVLEPYRDLGFDTAASGPVHVDWTASAADLTVDAKLTLAPPSRRTDGQAPISGLVDAEYFNRQGTVQIRSLEAHTPATNLRVQGALGVYPESRTSALKGDLTTGNLAEFDRTLTVLGVAAKGRKGVQALPVELQGQAEFQGEVTGTIFEPVVKGHVAVTNFATLIPVRTPGTSPQRVNDAPLQPPPTSIHGERKLEWDCLDATGKYSLEQISIQQATIARGRTVVHASGFIRPHRIDAHRTDFDEQSAIQAAVRVQDAAVTDLLAIAGERQVPVTGTLALDVQAGGTLDNLNGGGHVSIRGGEIYGEAYRSLSADLRFAGSELGITKLTLLQNGGQLSADGAYDLRSKYFRANAHGEGFELSHIRQLQSKKLPLAGRLAFDAHGSGTFASPAVHAVAHLEDLVLGGEPIGGLDADAHSEHGALFFSVKSHLRAAQLQIAGQTELRDGYTTQARLTFSELDMDPFLRLANVGGISGHSSIAGQLTVSGPLKEPKRLNGEADLSQFSIALAGVPLQSQGPVHAVLRDGVLLLDPLHITGEDTNLRAQGSVTLFGNRVLKLRADGAVNMKLAQTVNPDIASSGRMDFTLDARGTIEQPDLAGQVRFTNAAMNLQGLPNGLSQINGTLQFNQDRLDVKSLTAQTGGGQLKIGGYIAYQQGLVGDLTATGKNIRIRYPQGVSSMADANLRLQGSQNNLLLSGNILLTRFAINPDLDIAGLVGTGTSIAPPADPNAASNHVRLDVHITSAPALNFQNGFAKLAGDVDLRLRGTVASPSVLGRINVTEGSANFAGTQYQLQHGDIFFTNPVRIDPNIDLDATARVENYDITIGLHGTANKLNVSYRSEPPLAQADVIALLALGRTEEEQGMYTQQQQDAGANSTTNALLGGALNATVSNRVQKLFGVGSVKIDPTFVGSLGNSTARVTVEQQVARNVTLTYATNVNSSAQQLIQAQVDITRNVSVVAVRDEAGVFSMVLKVHRRFR